MASDGNAYVKSVLGLWVSMAAFAWLYAAQEHIPRFVAVAFVAAAVGEIALYLVPGFRSTLAAFDRIEPAAWRAFILTLSALPPYLIYSGLTGTFHWRKLVLLALFATASSAWFVVLNRRTAALDILYLVLVAAVVLAKPFQSIYIELHPRAPAAVLGQLMWIRVGVLSVRSIRKLGGIGFGLLPSGKEWKIGFQNFLAFMPVGILIGVWLRFMQARVPAGPWWKTAVIAAGTFCGILWVVALSEEFFFRGVLQQTLAKAAGNRWVGLVLASCAFGLVHLPFRSFPNWRFAILAAVAGVAYGLAYIRANSVRAAMVTHALVVTSWRVFFA